MDTFIAGQTRRSRSSLRADDNAHWATRAILRGITLENLVVSLNPDKNELYTGVAGDERKRLFQVFKQQVDGIKLANKGLLEQMQFVTINQGLSVGAMTSTTTCLDDLTQPTEAARLALNLVSLVSKTKIDMESFLDGKVRRDESEMDI